MSQLIVSSRYLKGGSESKRKNYIKYIATRETVEIREQNTININAPASEKQQELISSLLSDFPEAKRYLEYEDYTQNPTLENASELITTIIERHADVIGNRQNFVGYMALRPGVEKRGSHGLFNDSDEPIILDRAVKEIAEHPGNVWSHVVSLRREDAVRLGYDHSERWRELVKRHISDIAEQTRIPLCNLKWYAAYHDTTHHPHIHLIVYSENPKQGFLSKQGIDSIRSVFANDIFHDDLQSIYQEQTLRRNELKTESKKHVENLLKQISAGSFDDAELELLIQKLYSQLQDCKGKKVYGYLPKDVKSKVNEIFSALAQNRNIQLLYEKWCEMERQKYKTYTLNEKDFPQLQENKVFHSVRSMIIDQVLNMHTPLGGMDVPESEPSESIENSDSTDSDIEVMEIPSQLDESIDDTSELQDVISDINISDTELESKSYIKWSKQYQKACRLFYDKRSGKEDILTAEKLLLSEAESGNILAVHDLGKLYSTEKLGAKDEGKSFAYYQAALQGFLEIEPYADQLYPYEPKYPGRPPKPVDMRSYVWYRIGKMHCYGLGTEQNYEEAYRWFLKSAEEGNKFAQYSLGNLYYYGNGVEKNLSQAFHWYMKSAKQGQPYAAYAAAQFYAKGDVVPKDEKEAHNYYQKALAGFLKLEADKQADDNLYYKIGAMYKNGLGTETDMLKAVEYFRLSAELGNKHGLYEYGKALFTGEHIEKNIAQGLECLEKSISLGNINAKRFLALEYLSGEYMDQDIEKGISMLTECADSGDALSCYRLGKIYFKGEIVYPDYDKAEKYLLMAAKQGNEYAQYALGKLYLMEEKYDLQKAVQWLEQAVLHENISDFAGYSLAKILLEDNSYHNAERAVELLESAAEKNSWAGGGGTM